MAVTMSLGEMGVKEILEKAVGKLGGGLVFYHGRHNYMEPAPGNYIHRPDTPSRFALPFFSRSKTGSIVAEVCVRVTDSRNKYTIKVNDGNVLPAMYLLANDLESTGADVEIVY